MHILRFALPASLEVVLHQLFGLVDQVFVASLGEASFVAAGLTAQLVSLAFVFLAALGTGAAIQLARYAGAGDAGAFSAAAARMLQVAVGVAVLVAVGVVLGARPALQALGAAPEVVDKGVFFTRLVAWSLPFMALMELGNQVLRARGDARSPMVIGLAALAANSVLNYALIFGWWGLPEMGLAGAGVATLLARVLGFGLVCWLLFSRQHTLRVRWRDMGHLESGQVRALLVLALPVAAGQGAWLLGMMGYTRVYAELGTRELAAVNVVNQLESVCIFLSFGFGMACLTLVGQELGRRELAQARRVAAECLRLALAMSVVTGVLLSAAALVLGPLYPGLEAGTRALAVTGLLVSALVQPVKVRNMVMALGVLRGGGDVRFTMVCETFMLVGIACAWGLGVPLGWGLVGVLVGRACEEVLKLAAFSWRYASGRWVHEVR
jgi:putative MATE family efflux protein